MDRRLMEFCFGIPADQRTRDGMDKFILRNAMRSILPPAVQRRTSKCEFSVFMRQALAAADAGRRFESLEIAKLGWVNGDAVLEAFAAVRAGRFDSSSPKWRVPNLWALWMAFAIELWFRVNFIEAPDAAANSIADRPAGISAGA
jgi:asparagine synthase (glutamine-hydrolysing)